MSKIVISKDGPYLVTGDLSLQEEIIIRDEDGKAIGWEDGKSIDHKETYALCRCGHSKNKPFCDGTHRAAGFDGSETASLKIFEEVVNRVEGPGIDVDNARGLCASAGYCSAKGGTFNLLELSNIDENKMLVIEQAGNCPAGKIVAVEKTGEVIEPDFEQSVSVVQDPSKNLSGPIWAKGGIEIESADGGTYEVRNRVTLCRCGQSENKPFCDGKHNKIKFLDTKV